jgi:outer membrane lipoprotein SlyB
MVLRIPLVSANPFLEQQVRHKMNTSRISPFFVALVVSMVAGCTFPSSAPLVSKSAVGNVQVLDLGRVVGTRDVVVDGEKTLLGISGGAALGGSAAHPGGYSAASTGEVVAQAAAAVVGAVAGSAIEEAVTREKAQELTIELDDGRVVVIIQEVPDGRFQQGDRVQVNHGGWAPATVRLASN